jgi:hypothetical protein
MADNGTGEFGGNGSVWWRSVHGANQNPGRQILRWNGNGARPTVRDWVKAGDQADQEILGHDGVALDDVGSPGSKGKFKVTVRYTTRPENAVGAAIAGVATVPGGLRTDKITAISTELAREALRAVAIDELQKLVTSANAAIRQLQNAAPNQSVDVSVQFYVPVMRRSNPPAAGEWEVTVDW